MRLNNKQTMKPLRLFPLLSGITCCLLAVLFAAGCAASDSKAEPPRWIFLVTLDTTRADHIDYSQTGSSPTPNLAKLAAAGQYFANAYSLIPITLPAHASMFYSQPPHRLKIYNNGQVHNIAEPSVVQLLKQRGYSTGAVISLGVLKSDFGLNKGFDRYIENFAPSLWTRDADDVNRDAFNMIKQFHEQGGSGPFFFWLHYSDPHEPYFPPHEEGTGFFRVSLDERQLFNTRCTGQPAIDIAFEVPPGSHQLVFDTRIPPSFKDYPGSSGTFQYIKLRDFVLEPTAPGTAVTVPELTVPDHWNSKKTRSGINYYSEKETSALTLVNRSRGIVSMRLRFIYSLRVDDATRKVFYREEVKYMDSRLGRLMGFLKEKGIYDDAVFIIVGDHGEVLGDYRNHFGHIHFLNRTSAQVPLILAGKGIAALGKRRELVSILNIAPTILDIAAIKKPASMQGQSLLKPLAPTRLLLETYSPEAYFDAFSIIDYPFQVSFYPGRRKNKLEFFNLGNNTQGEAAKLDPDMRNARSRLVDSVLKISRIITATKGKIGKTTDERHREILKSLGYL
jgi:hypothetical protein